MGRFDAIAGEYDEWGLVDPYYVPLQYTVADVVIKHVGRVGGKVLELGIGTGRSAQEVLSWNPNLYLVGIDTSSLMIGLARNRLKADRSHVLLEVSDACDENIPAFQASDYDCVYSVCTMHNIEPLRRIKVCQNAWQCLEPGGLWVSGDKVVPDDPVHYLGLFDSWLRDLDQFRDRGMIASYDYWRLHELEDHLNRTTEAETQQMLESAGFVEVQHSERLGRYIVTTARKR